MYIINNLSNLKVIALMCAFKATLSLLISLIANLFLKEQDFINSSLEGFEVGEIFVIVVFLAPLLETFLFQFIFIELIIFIFQYFKIQKGEYFAILISSIVFSSTHNFSTFYMFNSLVSGLIYGWFYVFSKNKKGLNGFVTVFTVHSFSNLVAFFFNEFF